MYQQNEDSLGTKDESGYFFSAAYKIDGNVTLKAQYGAIEDDVDGDEAVDAADPRLGSVLDMGKLLLLLTSGALSVAGSVLL